MDSVGLVSQPWMGRSHLPGSVQHKPPELPAAFCEPVLVCLHLLQEDYSPTTSWEPWMRQGLSCCPRAPPWGHARPGLVLFGRWGALLSRLQSSESKATGRDRASGVMLCPPHRVLVEAVLPFPPALAEVTLGIGRGRRVILRSYQEEEAGEGTNGAWGREQRRAGGVQRAETGWRGQSLASSCCCPPQTAPSKPW